MLTEFHGVLVLTYPHMRIRECLGSVFKGVAMLQRKETTATSQQKQNDTLCGDRSLQASAQKFKALGDETRLRILGLLNHGELCVCDIMEVLGLPQSTASRHLAYLKNAQLVIGNRQGKWMYYRLDDAVSQDIFLGKIFKHLAELPQVQKDSQVLVSHLENKDNKTCS